MIPTTQVAESLSAFETFETGWINDPAHMNYDGIYSQSYTAAPVPEPGTLLLLGTGMAAMAGTCLRIRV